ncbi:MAG: hypothetical protein II405_03915 [Oscillospiraceae bacterium]|jgi:hypothetical protein|nr:hypothetical protein [Oscillospiraceae bacterium]MBQ5468487.1 hypothetical protein [Oscillospiraceae bacterium]
MGYCNRMVCCGCLCAGAAFLVAALAGSFWFCFLLGAALLVLGVILHR